MSITNQVFSLNLTNYQNQTVSLPMGFGEESLTGIADKICTLREYSKLGIILGIVLKMIPISIGDTQISEYSSMLIVSSLVIGLATTVFALKLEKMAQNALFSAREAKASGFSKYPSNGNEFANLIERINNHVGDNEVACNVNKLLDVLFNHSFAKPEFEESDGQLCVNMKASEQYKLIKGKEERTLYIPKFSKFWISKEGVITFGKTKHDFCCDSHVPYLIKIPSNLFKLNSYWSEIIVDPKGGLQVTGPNNFGLFVEHGGGTPMISRYKISDIS